MGACLRKHQSFLLSWANFQRRQNLAQQWIPIRMVPNNSTSKLKFGNLHKVRYVFQMSKDDFGTCGRFLLHSSVLTLSNAFRKKQCFFFGRWSSHVDTNVSRTT